MAPAQIPVFLSQKPSTKNGQLRVVALRLEWLHKILSLGRSYLQVLQVGGGQAAHRAGGAPGGLPHVYRVRDAEVVVKPDIVRHS